MQLGRGVVVLALALFGISLPSLAFGQETALPRAAIISPSPRTYTHAEEIFPAVAFASTSRIIAIEYLLEDEPVPYGKPLPLFEHPLGTTTFSVVMKDMDGTVATTSVTFFLSATPESLSRDITEAAMRGLITKQVIRDRMLRSLELFSDNYARKQEIANGTERKKTERIALLNERMEKLLDADLLDLLKKQEGRTIKKETAAMIRAHVESLRTLAH